MTTFGILSKLHGKKTALAFGAIVTCLAIVSGVLVDLTLTPVVTDLSTASEHGHSLVHIASLAGLGLLFLGSLWRNGVRGVFDHVFRPAHH